MGQVSGGGGDGADRALAVAAGWGVFVVANAQRIDVVPFFNELRAAYGVDYTGVGALLSAYLLGYVLAQIPAGFAADNLPTRRVTLAGLATITVVSAAFALSADFATALVLRFVMGLSGAALYSSTVKLTLAASPNRATTMGVLQSGAGAGMIVGLFLLPLLAQVADVRAALLAMAALSALSLLVAAVGLRRSPGPAAADRESFARQVRTVVGRRPFLYLSSCAFLALFSVYGITAWLPTYLRNVFGLDSATAGAIASLVNVALIVASPLGGRLSDRLGSRPRVMLVGYGLLVAAFALLAGIGQPLVVAASALVAGVGLSFTLPITTTLTTETFGMGRAGLAVSLQLAVGQVASTISGVLFGLLLDATGSFTVLWLVGLAVAALGYLPAAALRRLQPDVAQPALGPR